MICKNCGANLPDTAKFCKVCGQDPNAEPINKQPIQQSKTEQSYQTPQQNMQATVTQQQSATSEFFEKANILDYFKNPFKASYQAYNGGRREFAIFVFIFKCLIFPIAFFILSNNLIKEAEYNFGSFALELSKDEEKFNSTDVLIYTLLAILLSLIARWLINYIVAKMFGMKDLTLSKSFNLTQSTSAWSMITSAIGAFIIIRLPIKEIVSTRNEDLIASDLFYILAFLMIAEFIFRNILLFSTYLVTNPEKKPLSIALSLILSETINIFIFFVIASTIIPEALYQDLCSIVLTISLYSLFKDLI